MALAAHLSAGRSRELERVVAVSSSSMHTTPRLRVTKSEKVTP